MLKKVVVVCGINPEYIRESITKQHFSVQYGEGCYPPTPNLEVELSSKTELTVHNTDSKLLVINEKKADGKIEAIAVFKDWIYWRAIETDDAKQTDQYKPDRTCIRT